MKFYMSNIPVDVHHILGRLETNLKEAYIVGGCVRDSLMNKEPHDWDICTSATPDEICEIFKDYEVIPTGLKHGTVTIVYNGTNYEITTFRSDGDYTDRRRPDKVKFTTNIMEDLKRRDFTINGMAYNPQIGLIDTANGFEDLSAKIIKCIGNPEDRFNEDTLRILRALRFSAKLGFNIDRNTEIAIFKLYKYLSYVSMERINSEFSKIMESKNSYKIIDNFSCVIGFFIPELVKMEVCEQNNPYHMYNVFKHTIKALEACEEDIYGLNKKYNYDLITKLAILFHDVGKPDCASIGEDTYTHFKGHGKVGETITRERLTQMRYSNEIIDKVCQLVLYHDSLIDATPKGIKRMLNRLGVEQFNRLIAIRHADIMAQSLHGRKERIEKLNIIINLMNEIIELDNCFKLSDLNINGNDLIDLGLPPGKAIGKLLKFLLDIVIDDIVENDHEKLIKVAKAYITTHFLYVNLEDE